ncbi:hypothetical protein ACLKA7_012902 [Drosophila subpalustris]
MFTMRSPENVHDSAAGSSMLEPSDKCSICYEAMKESQEMSITKCAHTFHSACIMQYLQTKKECYICQTDCDESDLRPIVKPVADSANQGAIPKKHTHNTRYRGKARPTYRSQERAALEGDDDASLDNAASGTNSAVKQARRGRPGKSHNQRLPRANQAQGNAAASSRRNSVQNQIDYDLIFARMGQLIEEKFSAMSVNSQTQSPRQEQPATQVSPNHSNQSSRTVERSAFNLRPDKATQIINSWNVKFDGSVKGPTVQEFLYRVRALTADSLQNDFSLLCKNLHVILVGKVREWYWRFRKENPVVEWDAFCEVFKSQYHDNKDDDSILEDIRARKQKNGELFDTFYEDIMILVSRLSIPMDEYRLMQQLKRNLVPEVKQALLYETVHSVAHLRQLVQLRENLMGEEEAKRSVNRSTVAKPFKRIVSAVDTSSVASDHESASSELEVNAVQHNGKKFTCWNCDQEGHSWDMCLYDRNVFCYGCGAKGIYKPQCEVCSKRAENYRKGPSADSSRMAPKKM